MDWKEDLESWLAGESHYIRLRALVTGDTLKETIERVAPILYGDALLRFYDLDLLGLLAKRVQADRDEVSFSYTMIREMRAAIRMSQEQAAANETNQLAQEMELPKPSA